MDKHSLGVPRMKPIVYFRQLCKVMLLPSQFGHVTQKLSFRACRTNCTCDLAVLADFNPRTLHLGEDKLFTLNQKRFQDLSDCRLAQKDSATWTECTAVCVNTYRIKVTAADRQQLTVQNQTFVH
jgi:hypothetical protein